MFFAASIYYPPESINWKKKPIPLIYFHIKIYQDYAYLFTIYRSNFNHNLFLSSCMYESSRKWISNQSYVLTKYRWYVYIKLEIIQHMERLLIETF